MAKSQKPKIAVDRTRFAWGVFIGSDLFSEHHDYPSAQVTARDLRKRGGR